jgi:hypothetical protein
MASDKYHPGPTLYALWAKKITKAMLGDFLQDSDSKSQAD